MPISNIMSIRCLHPEKTYFLHPPVINLFSILENLTFICFLKTTDRLRTQIDFGVTWYYIFWLRTEFFMRVTAFITARATFIVTRIHDFGAWSLYKTRILPVQSRLSARAIVGLSISLVETQTTLAGFLFSK